jgi:hypothetical protein
MNSCNHHGALISTVAVFNLICFDFLFDSFCPGFRATKEWSPREYSGAMPTTSDFEEHISRREPFVVRSNDTALDAMLGWSVGQWTSADYLREQVGAEESVLVERRAKQQDKTSSRFGFGGGVYKSKMTFASFLADSNFDKNDHHQESSAGNVFLNLQDGYFRDGIWNSPLQKLQKDVPVPPCLSSRGENVSSVNMWMSNAQEGEMRRSTVHVLVCDVMWC